MLFLDSASIDRLIDPERLIELIKEFYIRKDVDVKERVSDIWRDTWVGFMRAYGSHIGLVAKIIGIFPKSEPRVKGLIIAIDMDSGDVKLIADAYSITGWRTAAASALAYTILSRNRRKIDILGVIGSGTQARYHLKIFTTVFDVDEIYIYGRNRAKASKIASEFSAIVKDHIELLRRSSVIIAATNSRSPVVYGDILKTNTIILSIGAPKPVVELDDAVRKRSKYALVDNKKGCEIETDDTKGLILIEIGEALSKGFPIDPGDLMIYKSVGSSLLDYVAVYHVIEKLRSKI